MGSQISSLKYELNSLREMNIKYQTKLGSTKQKVENHKTQNEILKLEIERLKMENEELKKQLLENNSSVKQGIHIISEYAIEKFVENQLLNDETNNAWIPDLIEMPMKKLPISQIVQFLNATVQSFHMKIYNHVITVNLYPDPEFDKS